MTTWAILKFYSTLITYFKICISHTWFTTCNNIQPPPMNIFKSFVLILHRINVMNLNHSNTIYHHSECEVSQTLNWSAGGDKHWVPCWWTVLSKHAQVLLQEHWYIADLTGYPYSNAWQCPDTCGILKPWRYSISQEICTRFLLCCGYTLTDFPISTRLTSLALWQSNDCPSASKATLMNMDKYFIWIHYERLHNHNKAKHNKTVCIISGHLGICDLWWGVNNFNYSDRMCCPQNIYLGVNFDSFSVIIRKLLCRM